MLQIALLLFGAEFIRGKAHYLWGIGLLWCFIGIFIFIDGVDGILFFQYICLVFYCYLKV